MSKATEQRVKNKLKEIAKTLDVPFNQLLETLFLERFLVRVSKSKHAKKLIFKGGMCLAQIIDLGRETSDLDFLLKEIEGSIENVTEIIEEIVKIDVGDDFAFSKVEVGILSLVHKKYPGYRVTVQGSLGQIKNKISVDIGMGDAVRPRLLEVELLKSKTPLFEESINLNSYPAEYIFSEKFEAILHLGELNSRMKDFYDCFRLIKDGELDLKSLKKAVNETLERRGTKLELIPSDTSVHESKWKSFLKKNCTSSAALRLFPKILS